jgi:hypothetical protein
MLDWGVGEYAKEYDVEVSTDGRCVPAVSRRLPFCAKFPLFFDDRWVSGVAQEARIARPFLEATFLSSPVPPTTDCCLVPIPPLTGRRVKFTSRADP